MMITEALLRTGQVAQELAVSTARVHQLADRGAIPVAAQTEDGWRLFRRADIEAYRARRAARRRPASPSAPTAA